MMVRLVRFIPIAIAWLVGSIRNTIAWLVRLIPIAIAWLLNPVLFLTCFGPLLVVQAMNIINGFALRDGGELKNLFDNKALPGLVDYTTQYYTAFLVSVFWFRFCLQKGLVHQALKYVKQSPDLADAEMNHDNGNVYRDIQTLVAVVIMIILLLLYLGGHMTNLKTLRIYIMHSPQLGDWKIPPLESPITWVRGIVGCHGLLLMFLKEKSA